MKVLVRGIALSGLVVFLAAQVRAEVPSFEAFAHEWSQVRRLGHPLCPQLTPTEFSSVTFVFEGFRGYAPATAFLDLPFDAGGNSRRQILQSQISSEADQEQLNAWMGALETQAKQENAWVLGSLLTTLKSTPSPARGKILYYGWYHMTEALKCALSLPPGSSIRLIGFSMGGGAVIRLVRRLEKAAITVDQVLTLDPVRRSVRSVGSVLVQSSPSRFKRRPNVRYWQNIYQIADRGTISSQVGLGWPRLHIHGSPVDQADLEIRLGTSDFLSLLHRAHLELPKLEVVQSAMLKALSE